VPDPMPDPGPVVQENPRPRKNPGRSKNAWALTLGTVKPQVLVQTQLDLYIVFIPEKIIV